MRGKIQFGLPFLGGSNRCVLTWVELAKSAEEGEGGGKVCVKINYSHAFAIQVLVV